MTSPADIIQALLQADGLPGSGWQSFVGFMPPDPDKCICAYDTPGNPDGRLMATGERIEHPGVQIQVRGLDYVECFAKVRAITQALDSTRKVSVAPNSTDSYTVANVSRTGTPISLGIEEVNDRRRHVFAINMTITYAAD